MCLFITSVLPPAANVTRVQEIATAFGRAWRPIMTGPVVSQLQVGETYYLTTSGHCDCGTVLGQASTAAAAEASRARKRDQLRRKGWSDPKIERWLADKSEADRRRHGARSNSSEIDAPRWLELLRTVVSSGATEKVALLLHWYSGPVSDADFPLIRQGVALSNATPEFLQRMEEDRLYEFAA